MNDPRERTPVQNTAKSRLDRFGEKASSLLMAGLMVAGGYKLLEYETGSGYGYQVVGEEVTKGQGLLITPEGDNLRPDGSIVINGRPVVIEYRSDEYGQWNDRLINSYDDDGFWQGEVEECVGSDLKIFEFPSFRNETLVKANSPVCEDGFLEPSDFATNESSLG